jgi:type 1 glutamine amidotransferase
MTRVWVSSLLSGAILVAAVLVTAQNPPAQAPATFPGGPGRGPEGGRIPRGPRNMKVLLAWADTRNGLAQHDSTSHALAVIERLGYETGTYFTYIRTDSNIISYHPTMTTGQPASGGPSLADVDAIFFLGHRDVPIDDIQKAELLKFVHDDGKGFVAAHTASNAWMSWPEFGDLLGGRYDEHPWGVTEASVIVEAPDFPGMKFFPRMFAFRDEFYQIKDFSPEKSRVLMRLDTSNLDLTKQGVHPADAPFPLTWARTYGKGRVFYSSLGHDASTWDNPDIQRMWFEAIKWSLGLIDADVAPRPVSASPVPVPTH